mmetsp:Transcript_62304/g.56180  ORF Transcript_62304/g.56180 Transcript_62304/m.56180 type:complete len:304 (+) Transcript_62304:116-1027(+)
MPSIQTQEQQRVAPTLKVLNNIQQRNTNTTKCGELSPRNKDNECTEGTKQSSSHIEQLFFQNICSIYMSQPIQSHHKQYVVIFDWDDTLHPTTVITNKKEYQSIQLLLTFGKRLYELLSYYIKMFGGNNIYIITNATKYWPLKSLQMLSSMYKNQVIKNKTDNNMFYDINYFSAIYALLSILKIKIISANHHYSKEFPNVPLVWKIKTFQAVTNQHFDFKDKENIYTLISIGDSESEFVASTQAKTMLMKQNGKNGNGHIFRLHRIKLQRNPSIKQMMKQFKCLMDEAYLLKIERGSITICYP